MFLPDSLKAAFTCVFIPSEKGNVKKIGMISVLMLARNQRNT